MKGMLIFCALALLLVPCLAQSDIPEVMSYQGVLRDTGGNTVPDGSYAVKFYIYDVETGGGELWSEVQTLTATGGIINAHLGSVTTLSTLEFDVPYWLAISVEAEDELVPRTALTTVPYAAHAAFADHCTEGDDDWTILGDDIHHDVGYVGIGTATPDVALDVFVADEACARFENNSGGGSFTVRAANSGGTAGAFFAGTPATSYPSTPAAVFGMGGAISRGGQFYSEGRGALYASSPNGKAVHGSSTGDYAGYFSGGGMGVYVADLLETSQFRMEPGMGYGYVLTSDGSGNGTWQPAAAVSDGDWTVAANDMYSAVSGRVGIGLTLPTAKLEIYNETSEEALEVKYGGTGAGRAVNFERTAIPEGGQDLLQLKIPEGSPDNSQFIECERGTAINFKVDGDGSIISTGTLEVSGSDENQGVFSSSSVTSDTKVVSGIATGTGVFDPIGVYGESVPSDYFGIGGSFLGGYRGVEGQVASTGGDQYRGVYGRVYGGTGGNYGVYGTATGAGTNYGVYGSVTSGTGYAGYFAGDAHVTVTFTAGIKSFKIDHPLDPENKYLLHSCVESDEMMNIYNGNVMLDARGEAWVEMPDWFEALNRDFRYQLTAIGAPGPNLYVAEKLSGNAFRIAGGEPGSEVSWQVTGVRHDPLAVASRMVVEVDKPANEVGKYMHPEAYGMPLTAGIDYHEEREVVVSSGPAGRKPLEAFDPNDGE